MKGHGWDWVGVQCLKAKSWTRITIPSQQHHRLVRPSVRQCPYKISLICDALICDSIVKLQDAWNKASSPSIHKHSVVICIMLRLAI